VLCLNPECRNNILLQLNPLCCTLTTSLNNILLTQPIHNVLDQYLNELLLHYYHYPIQNNNQILHENLSQIKHHFQMYDLKAKAIREPFKTNFYVKNLFKKIRVGPRNPTYFDPKSRSEPRQLSGSGLKYIFNSILYFFLWAMRANIVVWW
jgi:hypothetical protein